MQEVHELPSQRSQKKKMKKYAFYNEFDPYAAQWLRNLMAAGHIAPGYVDERSIEDVTPYDLREFKQCHFFAGIGTWSLALRRAGWSDDRRVWTASCPCQPFSAAGQNAGFDDERHLWPSLHWLVQQCRPPVIYGEQVASKAADVWIDLVQADMEGLDYAFGAVAFPAASVGAPHIRDRTYWLGHANRPGLEGHAGYGRLAGRQGAAGPAASAGVHGGLADDHQHGRIAPPVAGIHDTQYHAESCGGVVGMGDADSERAGRNRRAVCGSIDRQDRELCADDAGAPSRDCGLADDQLQQRQDRAGRIGNVHDAGRRDEGTAEAAGLRNDCRPGPTNGHWAAADWLGCRDGKWRPVEPGTFPLAHGSPARVGRLRAYGNGIVTAQAETFILATG